MSGKQIVVIDSQQYCPYCEKFKKNVSNDYQGSIPLTFRLADQLDGLTVTTETWATPTILFLEDGKEIFGRQGYIINYPVQMKVQLLDLGLEQVTELLTYLLRIMQRLLEQEMLSF